MATVAHTPDARTSFLDDYRRVQGSLPGADRPWVAELRRRAIDRFAEVGFPAPKSEDWKYTNVAPILRERFEPSVEAPERSLDDAIRAALLRAPGLELAPGVHQGPELPLAGGTLLTVFVNGRYVDAASTRASSPAVEISNSA